MANERDRAVLGRHDHRDASQHLPDAQQESEGDVPRNHRRKQEPAAGRRVSPGCNVCPFTLVSEKFGGDDEGATIGPWQDSRRVH